jgi:hypothetical protein
MVLPLISIVHFLLIEGLTFELVFASSFILILKAQTHSSFDPSEKAPASQAMEDEGAV